MLVDFETTYSNIMVDLETTYSTMVAKLEATYSIMLDELEATYNLPSDQQLAESEALGDSPWFKDINVWLAELEAFVGLPSDTVSVSFSSDQWNTCLCLESYSFKASFLKTPRVKHKLGQLYFLTVDSVRVGHVAKVKEKPAWCFWRLPKAIIQGPSCSDTNKVP